MRNGYSTKTSRKKNITLSPVNRCHRPQHQYHGRTFMVRRSCSESDGTKRVFFTMSCWNGNSITGGISIGYNWFVWAVHWEKNGRNTSKDMIKLFFFNNTRPHVAKVVKKYLGMLKFRDVLPHPPYSPNIAPSDYWLFRRNKLQQVTGSLLSQKIGSKIGSSPKTSHFFEMEFENCLRDGKK